jgi:hypothetical protein
MSNLENEKAALLNEFRGNLKAMKATGVLKKIKAIDAKIKVERKIELLNKVNAEQQRLRELAAFLWDCEIITSEILNNDLSFHGTKAKKYPKIVAAGVRVMKVDGPVITKINIKGKNFQMVSSHYESGKKIEYTRPATFYLFLQLNSIRLFDISIETYDDILAKAETARTKLKNAMADYKTETTGFIEYNVLNLLRYDCEHVYSFEKIIY